MYKRSITTKKISQNFIIIEIVIINSKSRLYRFLFLIFKSCGAAKHCPLLGRIGKVSHF